MGRGDDDEAAPEAPDGAAPDFARLRALVKPFSTGGGEAEGSAVKGSAAVRALRSNPPARAGEHPMRVARGGCVGVRKVRPLHHSKIEERWVGRAAEGVGEVGVGGVELVPPPPSPLRPAQHMPAKDSRERALGMKSEVPPPPPPASAEAMT